MLTPTEARVALGELLAAATGSVGVREIWAARLVALAPGDLVRLDDNARTGWPWNGPSWTELAADPQALAENTGVVAAVASMHPNGRIRQTAVGTLADRPGRLPAALLVLRSVDHVPQVRADATTGLAGHASVEEAHAALPVLLAVAARMHGLPALGRYAAELMNHHGGVRVMLGLLDSDDRRTRRGRSPLVWTAACSPRPTCSPPRRTGTIRSSAGSPPTRSSTGTPPTRRRCGRC